MVEDLPLLNEWQHRIQKTFLFRASNQLLLTCFSQNSVGNVVCISQGCKHSLRQQCWGYIVNCIFYSAAKYVNHPVSTQHITTDSECYELIMHYKLLQTHSISKWADVKSLTLNNWSILEHNIYILETNTVAVCTINGCNSVPDDVITVVARWTLNKLL
jgi:hypothetical protein